MQLDFSKLAAASRYELLLGTVVPRPIALITTLAEDGTVNAAPYSLFNVVSHDPPTVMVAVLPHPDGRLKDTAGNILARREFVVNLVPEALAEAMNVACIDAPPGRAELELARVATAPSVKVKPPRVAASPVAFECTLTTSLSFAANQAVVFGQVLSAFVADTFVLDADRGLIDTPALKLIGGMHGARWYTRTSDRFAMERPTWAEWVRQGRVS
jgi:flavin reductase (DIM6/NTAB) family NADH-FMN oxidoreductase RutF